jgi:hypothetical protein
MQQMVLVSPLQIGTPDWQKKELPIMLTMEEVKNCSTLNMESLALGKAKSDGTAKFKGIRFSRDDVARRQGHYHGRNCQKIINSHIRASDGNVGWIKGMLIDIEAWTTCYVVINIGKWWQTRQVLIEPRWIKTANWPDTYLSINLNRQAILDAPTYALTTQIGPMQEKEIQEHYNVAKRWIDETVRKTFCAKN